MKTWAEPSVYGCLGGKADNRENKGKNIGILTKPSQSNTVYDGG